jgi:hypothetical protein
MIDAQHMTATPFVALGFLVLALVFSLLAGRLTRRQALVT